MIFAGKCLQNTSPLTKCTNVASTPWALGGQQWERACVWLPSSTFSRGQEGVLGVLAPGPCSSEEPLVLLEIGHVPLPSLPLAKRRKRFIFETWNQMGNFSTPYTISETWHGYALSFFLSLAHLLCLRYNTPRQWYRVNIQCEMAFEDSTENYQWPLNMWNSSSPHWWVIVKLYLNKAQALLLLCPVPLAKSLLLPGAQERDAPLRSLSPVAWGASGFRDPTSSAFTHFSLLNIEFQIRVICNKHSGDS